MAKSKQERVIAGLMSNRVMAHEVLFPHRHTKASPDFHPLIIDAFHSTRPRVVTEAFRGGAKSTLAEEGVVIRGGFREFKNALIIGASEERAMERLESIKHEIEANDMIAQVFGDMRGSTWAGHKIQLASGPVIQAYGAGQSLRGAKHHEDRPDFCLIDDFEDEETVKSEAVIEARLRWLYKTLFPALDPEAAVRFIGNRLAPKAVIVRLAEDPDWHHQRFPIMYRDAKGEWASSWPDRFSLEWIFAKREQYRRLGLLQSFNQEYMCEAEVEDEKSFRAEMITVKPRARTWEATQVFYDPARSVNARSASTGKAVWSWLGNRLIVWDGFAKMLMPDEMIADIFDTDAEYHPVLLGVEEDGLNEWLMQPLRQAQVRRAHPLPHLKAVRAPKGKLDFIRGLQPFFNAREVEFVKEMPELRAQLLGFPSGRIDFPNALAYALRLRPGSPIYDDFGQANVIEEALLRPNSPFWLAMNATGAVVTAVLMQHAEQLVVIADWVEEGDPGQVAARILSAANLEAGRAVRPIGGPTHFDHWNNVGLRQALMRVPADLRSGTDPARGRDELRSMLRRQVRNAPALLVSHQARWTLNAFAGGYARAVHKGGVVSDHAEEGVYRTLMEGVESFAGLLKLGSDDEDRGDIRYADSRDGRRYMTALSQRS